MSLVLNIPPELEAELTTQAAQLGLDLPGYALRLLTVGRNLPLVPRTGNELLAYWQGEGLIGTRSEITDAPAYARNLREQSQTRERP